MFLNSFVLALKAVVIAAKLVTLATILSCFFFFFLLVDLYFLLFAVIAQIFNPIAELAIPIGVLIKEAKAEIDIHRNTSYFFLNSFILALRVVLVAELVISNILSTIFFALNIRYIFFTSSFSLLK